MPAGHGGARPGAGRKPKAERFAGPVAEAEQRIADRLPELIDNLFVLAAGVRVQEADKDGGVDIYTEPPDRRANEYLIDRVLGKPRQAVEHSGPDGGPIGHEVDVRTLSDDELRAIVASEG